MSDSDTVKLGRREYPVVAQPIGRIRRKLSAIGALSQGENEGGGEITEQLYEALKVFIPGLAPSYELAGYVSEEAQENDEYDPAADGSPTAPQIADTIEKIFEVNGGPRFTRLLKSLGVLELIQPVLRQEMRKAASQRYSSSPASGDSPSESSTTTSPTENGNGASPSPSSSDSSTPEESAESPSFASSA